MVNFDVTQTMQAWYDGQSNQGWLLLSDDKTRGLESLTEPPELHVIYARSSNDEARIANQPTVE